MTNTFLIATCLPLFVAHFLASVPYRFHCLSILLPQYITLISTIKVAFTGTALLLLYVL